MRLNLANTTLHDSRQAGSSPAGLAIALAVLWAGCVSPHYGEPEPPPAAPSASRGTAQADAAVRPPLDPTPVETDAAVTAPRPEPTPDPQRVGDPARGLRLLIENGTPEAPYLSCGIPSFVWNTLGFGVLTRGDLDIPTDEPALAVRKDHDLPYYLSSAVRPSGEKVINANCLLCHGGKLGNSGVVVGMPDATRDFTASDSLISGVPSLALGTLAALASPATRTELERFKRAVDAQADFPSTDTVGVNPADLIFTTLAAHHDPRTLAWRPLASATLTAQQAEGIFVDVPPWWNMHRREHMFHSSFGRGDHARIMATASLLCVDNTREAAAIDAYFPDILAYVSSLRAPHYEAHTSRPIDFPRAERGRRHFDERCVRCHGGKADEGPEPLSFVSTAELGTDSAYAELTQVAPAGTRTALTSLFEFFNESWYGTEGAVGRLEAQQRLGYTPPPLDGVWATAPYLHNGSVPTLEALLDPRKRPRLFKRSFDPTEYDFDKLGWPFQEVASKGGDKAVYDTTRRGYSNTGHTFAADLGDEDRRDLLEYLKTF